MTDTTTEILNERGARYGKFTGHAMVTQDLKDIIRSYRKEGNGSEPGRVRREPAYEALAPDQREALDMIAHKIGRILNGDPDYEDSWRDIAGYAQLVADRLKGVSR